MQYKALGQALQAHQLFSDAEVKPPPCLCVPHKAQSVTHTSYMPHECSWTCRTFDSQYIHARVCVCVCVCVCVLVDAQDIWEAILGAQHPLTVEAREAAAAMQGYTRSSSAAERCNAL